MKLKKKKILFVYEYLVQGGAQRYMCELIKLIDKEKFEPIILTGRRGHKKNNKWVEKYYLDYVKMGIKVHQLMARPPQIKEQGKKNLLLKIINKVIKGLYFPILYYYKQRLSKLLYEVDYITIIDFYTYDFLKNELQKHTKYDVHLMCHTFQFPNMFATFATNTTHHFFYFCPLQKANAISFGLKNSIFFHLPLLIDLRNRKNLYASLPEEEGVKNIGVFTRLDGNNKLIDMFILAFHNILMTTSIKCRLLLIGNVTFDPTYTNHINKLVQFLGIQEKVFFEGHQVDLENYLLKKKIHLAWHTSIVNTIGYSGIEIGSSGIPSIFFSLVHNKSDVNEEVDYYYDLTSFTNRAIEILKSPIIHKKASTSIRNYCIEKYHAPNYKKIVDDYYTLKAAK